MTALAAHLFREVRPDFFRVLAGSLAYLYVDALDALEREAVQRSQGLGRDEALALVEQVSMSTGNIPYAFEHCDWLVVVSKDERRLGKRTEIRNVPVSLARDSEDARRLMGS